MTILGYPSPVERSTIIKRVLTKYSELKTNETGLQMGNSDEKSVTIQVSNDDLVSDITDITTDPIYLIDNLYPLNVYEFTIDNGFIATTKVDESYASNAISYIETVDSVTHNTNKLYIYDGCLTKAN